MLDLFRKNQKKMMAVVATIIIIAFAFFGDFDGSSSGSGGARDYIEVDGG